MDNNYLDNQNELQEDRFNLFMKAAFHDKYEIGKQSLNGQVYGRNLKMIRIAAIIVFVTSCFWLFYDVKNGGAMNLTSIPAMTVLLLQSILSVYMVIISFLNLNKSGLLVRLSFFVYYICLIVYLITLVITKNIHLLNSGADRSIAGITLSSFFVMIIVIIPVPSKTDSIILGVVYVAGLIFPAFMPGREVYSLIQYSILGICVIVIYWHMRNMNIKLAKNIHQLLSLSYTDQLTGILNRRALDIYWDNICESNMTDTVGIIMFDIDDFKKYNDYYSHTNGDKILATISKCVLGVFDNNDCFLFRYGGEEFVVLMPDYSEDELLACGRKIRLAIENQNIPRIDDDSPFDIITVTVGCAKEQKCGDGNTDYIMNADRQLYIGKENGKNCVAINEKIYK